MSSDDSTFSDEDLLRMLDQIQGELTESKQSMYEFAEKANDKASKLESIIKLQFKNEANLYGYLAVLTEVIQLNIYSIIDLRDAIKKLPTREEFDASKSEVEKVKQKAIKSINAIKKTHQELKKHQPPKDMSGYG